MTKPLIAPTGIVRDYPSNSLVWEGFLTQDVIVEGDILIVTPVKSGTTWTQRIIQRDFAQRDQERTGSHSDTSPWPVSSWAKRANWLTPASYRAAARLPGSVSSSKS